MSTSTTFRSGANFRAPMPQSAQEAARRPVGALLLASQAAKVLGPVWRGLRLTAPLFAPLGRFIGARADFLLRAMLAIFVCLQVFSLLQDWAAAPSSPKAVAPVAPHAVWLDIAKPFQLYQLPAPQLAHEKMAYAARRHATGGGREDSLTFGEFGGRKVFLRLSLYRHGAEDLPEASFFVDMARHAAPLGLSVSHAELEQAMPTRFGEFETAPLALSEKRVARKNCRGFRRVDERPGLTIEGFACGPGEEAMNATELACLLDRFDLVAAGDDKALAAYFGAAESHADRPWCDSVKRKSS